MISVTKFAVSDVSVLGIIVAIFLCALTCVSIAAWHIRRSPWVTTVECWFCQKRTKVRRSDRSSWTCPQCEQYNGFAADGGYNQPVPGQSMSSSSINSRRVCPTRRSPSNFKSHSDVLCRQCNDNQLLKVQQLSHFEPLDENNYDEELKLFQAKLERSLRLCRACESRTSSLIRRCDRRVQPALIKWKRSSPVPSRPGAPSKFRVTIKALLALIEIATSFVLLAPPSGLLLPAACILSAFRLLQLISGMWQRQTEAVKALLCGLSWIPGLFSTVIFTQYPWRLLGVLLYIVVRLLTYRTSHKVQEAAAGKRSFIAKEFPRTEEMEDVEEEDFPRPPSTPSIFSTQNNGLQARPSSPSIFSAQNNGLQARPSSPSIFSAQNNGLQARPSSPSIFSAQNSHYAPSSVTSWQTAPLIRPSKLGLALAPSISSQLTASPSFSEPASVHLRSVSSYSPLPSCCSNSQDGESESVSCAQSPTPVWRQVCIGLLLGVNGAVIIYMVLLPALEKVTKMAAKNLKGIVE